ncbi:MAG: S1 family peptidase [Bacillota bacterium]
MLKFSANLSLTGILVVGLAACTPSKQSVQNNFQPDGSIIGGTAVSADDVVSKSTVAIIASVVKKDGEQAQFLCTGSMIQPNVVLTAAHCVPSSANYSQVTLVVAFTRDLKSMKKTDLRRVVDAKVHESYGDGDRRLEATIKRLQEAGNPTGEGVQLSDADQGADNNDIALLKISGQMPEGYQLAQILTDDSLIKAGTSVTLAGYGVTSVTKTPVDPKAYPHLDEAIATGEISCSNDKTECYVLKHNNENILKKTDVQVTSLFGNTEVELSQSQGKGACHGDSGGPAFLNVGGVEYVWGVTSRGSGKNGIDDCSDMALYTKANDFKDFIVKTLDTWK